MGLSKKFTAEFPHYLKNVGICATGLFGNLAFRPGDPLEKKRLSSFAKASKPKISQKYEKSTIKVVSFNIMKFLNKEKILACFDDYIAQGFDTFLIQEAIVVQGSNELEQYFTDRWFFTYFHPTLHNQARSKLMDFDLIGVMIASRCPIEHTGFLAYDLVRPKKGWYYGEVYFGVGYAQVDCKGVKIGIYSTHAEWFTRPVGRGRQIRQYLDWIAGHSDDIQIIWGDFNSWFPLRLETFARELEHAGFRYFAPKKPFVSLDHIWIRGEDVQSRPMKIASSGSDHTAIACEISR